MSIAIPNHRLLNEYGSDCADQFINRFRHSTQNLQNSWNVLFENSTFHTQKPWFNPDFETMEKISESAVPKMQAALNKKHGRLDLVPDVTNAILAAAKDVWPQATQNYVYEQPSAPTTIEEYYRKQMREESSRAKISYPGAVPKYSSASEMQKSQIEMLVKFAFNDFGQIFSRQQESIPPILADVSYYGPVGNFFQLDCAPQDATELSVYGIRIQGNRWLSTISAKLAEGYAPEKTAEYAYKHITSDILSIEGAYHSDIADIKDVSNRLDYASEAYEFFSVYTEQYSKEKYRYAELSTAYKTISEAFAVTAQHVRENYPVLPSTRDGYAALRDDVLKVFQTTIEQNSDLNIFFSSGPSPFPPVYKAGGSSSYTKPLKYLELQKEDTQLQAPVRPERTMPTIGTTSTEQVISSAVYRHHLI